MVPSRAEKYPKRVGIHYILHVESTVYHGLHSGETVSTEQTSMRVRRNETTTASTLIGKDAVCGSRPGGRYAETGPEPDMQASNLGTPRSPALV